MNSVFFLMSFCNHGIISRAFYLAHIRKRMSVFDKVQEYKSLNLRSWQGLKNIEYHQVIRFILKATNADRKENIGKNQSSHILHLWYLNNKDSRKFLNYGSFFMLMFWQTWVSKFISCINWSLWRKLNWLQLSLVT